MHELPVVESMLRIVLQHAVVNRARKVVTITLNIGEMSDLETEWIQKYFDYSSRDTMAEGAALNIARIPIVLECRGCGHNFSIKREEFSTISCPKCESGYDFDLITGKEYYIKEIVVV